MEAIGAWQVTTCVGGDPQLPQSFKDSFESGCRCSSDAVAGDPGRAPMRS